MPVDGAITPDLLASLLRVAPAPPVTQPVQPAVGVYPPEHKAFESFKECDVCPKMVALPGGTFTMGSPANEARGSGGDDEQQLGVDIVFVMEMGASMAPYIQSATQAVADPPSGSRKIQRRRRASGLASSVTGTT
jgi:hypothetical protein